MKGRLIPVVLFLAASGGIAGPARAQAVLDKYIKQGLDSNLALRQKDVDLQKARLDLKRAQSLFYPQAGFNMQYTLAQGGRTQNIPIGDLLNDVYGTLNQLTASNKFPQVSNQAIQFLPNNFHDSRFEVSMPLVNRQIRYNRDVSEEMIRGRQASVDAYKRELVRTMKEAYYRFLQADKAVSIYTNAMLLVNENLRVSEKLMQNDMATKETVLRARSQVSQVQSALIEARNNRQNAAAYFNFLLNKPLTDPVIVDSLLSEQPVQLSTLNVTETNNRREEFAQLRSLKSVLNTTLKWNRNYLIPTVNAFYQIGFQGFGFKFNNDQFYQLGGIQLQWPLFRANDNRYKIRQTELDLHAVNVRQQELEQQISLQVQTARNNYESAIEMLQTRRSEMESSQETWRFTERRFREGQALQIELIDARTQLTSAQLQYSLAQLTLLTRAAELEYATASYTF